MPRNKTLPPEPVETIECDEGGERLIIEVYDTDRLEIGKPAGRKNYRDERFWKIVCHVVDDYLTPEGRKSRIENDYLVSGNQFARHVILNAARWGVTISKNADDSAFRKRHYKAVLRELRVFEAAIKSRQLAETAKRKIVNRGTT